MKALELAGKVWHELGSKLAAEHWPDLAESWLKVGYVSGTNCNVIMKIASELIW